MDRRIKLSSKEKKILPQSSFFSQDAKWTDLCRHENYGNISRDHFPDEPQFDQLTLLNDQHNPEALFVSLNGLHHLYFTYQSRVSYRDPQKRRLIYHLKFQSLLDGIHEISVYEADSTNLIAIDYNDKSNFNGQYLDYCLLAGSYLHIDVKLSSNSHFLLIEILDRDKQRIFTHTIPCTYTTPLLLLKKHLEMPHARIKGVENPHRKGIERILDFLTTHMDRTVLKKTIYEDFFFLQLLLHYFLFDFDREKCGEEVHLLLEYIFTSEVRDSLKLDSLKTLKGNLRGFYGIALERENLHEVILRKRHESKPRYANRNPKRPKIYRGTK